MCIGSYSILYDRRIYEFLCVHSNPIWKCRNFRDYRPSHLTFHEYFRPFWFSRFCVVAAYCNRHMRSSNVQGFVSTVPTVYEEEEEFVRFTKSWRNLIIIPSFQYSEHALESYCHCASFSVYVIRLKRKQQWFYSLKYVKLCAWKSVDFGLEDEERPGQPKKFEDEEMEALLDEYC